MFNKEAKTIIIEHCYSPVSRQCHAGAEDDNNVGVGGTFCKVMFETDCRTVYKDDNQQDDDAGANRRKSLPQTICKRLPKTLCGGSNCEFVQVSVYKMVKSMVTKYRVKVESNLKNLKNYTKKEDYNVQLP